ncbi:endothelin-converting enzyme homolog isoform X2 [Branchiostoma floridae x Branchiostoma japonicum]
MSAVGYAVVSTDEDQESSDERDTLLPLQNGYPASAKMTEYKRHENVEEDIPVSNASSQVGTPMEDVPPVVLRTKSLFLGKWGQWTSLERILIILSCLLGLTCIILGALYGAAVGRKEVCLTPHCVMTASKLMSSMNMSIDPCDDFYQYACQGWIRSHPIPDGKTRWGTFGQLWAENQQVMRTVLEELDLDKAVSQAEKKAKLYYLSCMDANDTVEELGAKPLLDIIEDLGGWNATGTWNEENWDFPTLFNRLHQQFDLSPLFSAWVGTDDRNSSVNIFQVDQGGLGLPDRDYYLNKSATDEVLVAYLTYMTELGMLLGGDRNETMVLMSEVLDFETELANITTPDDQRRDQEIMYHRYNLSFLQGMAPMINWTQYFTTMLTNTGISVTPSEQLVVYAPEYLQHVTRLVSRTPNHVLNNYLVWKVVSLLAPYLSKPFQDAGHKMTEVLTGKTEREATWKECISETNEVAGFALGAMFVREAFHNSKAKAEEMIGEVKGAFIRNLPNLQWMDDETRRAAEDKAEAVYDMIGFPDYILDPEKLDKKYELLELRADDYFGNYVRFLAVDVLKNMKKLRQPVDRRKWSMTPPEVNAYYSPNKNEIVFPAGILQPPFYDPNSPKSLNFGGIGVVMGHELTHGFDDSGREFDKFGNLKPWWNNVSVAKFKQQAQCMVDQYSGYTINGEHVDGKQTLGENIADNGGLKSAFHAYEDWKRRNGDEVPLPAVGLSHNQLFFVSFAQVWCDRRTEQMAHEALLTDTHSPAKWRVIGTLSNSKDFARAFNCPVGSTMNPKDKCEVW